MDQPQSVAHRTADAKRHAVPAGPAQQISRAQAGCRAGPAAPKLEVRELSFFYGKFKALHDINLDIHERQVTAFIGPSGCGKSTLLRTFNRIYELYPGQRATGRIGMGDQNLLDGARRREQGPREDRHGVSEADPLSDVGPRQHQFRRARSTRSLSRARHGRARRNGRCEKAALWDEVKDKLRQDGTALSGGQQQRLCIARAVAVKPEVLLLDEPASALDPISTQKIEQLISELKSEYTIAVVTHNMQQAARVSDYTAFMYLGRVVEFGDTKTLFTHPTRAADGGVHHGEVRMSTTGLREHTSHDFEAELAAVRAQADGHGPPGRRGRRGERSRADQP